MKKKKTLTLTLIGLFIFLFGVIGITYAYWQLTLTQTSENLVYTDCLKITTTLGNGSFTLTDAYPMTNAELLSDFFPSQTPYHFTITNECEKEIPLSINMESLNVEGNALKDEYVDVILWEDNETNVFDKSTDTVLSKEDSTTESKYQLTKNPENEDKIITGAKKAYQLYNFKIGANTTKQFNLLLFMDYITPVSSTSDVTNNATWQGKITLNNYIPKVKIGGIEVELADSGNGLYAVEHKDASISGKWQETEYRYAGLNPDNYVWFNCDEGYPQVEESNKSHCEKWRIIGLVNVKTESGDIEQRLKIIREDKIGDMAWNNENNVNDWTQSGLMQELNGNYYNSLEGEKEHCYSYEPLKSYNCNFSASGIKEATRNSGMIDENIIWNIGSSTAGEEEQVTVNIFYDRERGTIGGNSAPEKYEWSFSNTLDETTFHSIGLAYPSEVGVHICSQISEL